MKPAGATNGVCHGGSLGDCTPRSNSIGSQSVASSLSDSSEKKEARGNCKTNCLGNGESRTNGVGSGEGRTNGTSQRGERKDSLEGEPRIVNRVGNCDGRSNSQNCPNGSSRVSSPNEGVGDSSKGVAKVETSQKESSNDASHRTIHSNIEKNSQTPCNGYKEHPNQTRTTADRGCEKPTCNGEKPSNIDCATQRSSPHSTQNSPSDKTPCERAANEEDLDDCDSGNCSASSSSLAESTLSTSPVSQSSSTLVAYHRKMLRQTAYFLSAHKYRPILFGIPLIVPCPEGATNQDLYQNVWLQVRDFL